LASHRPVSFRLSATALHRIIDCRARHNNRNWRDGSFHENRFVLFFAALLIALAVARSTLWAQAEKPLSKAQIQDLLRSGVTTHRVEALIGRRGIDFEPGQDDFQALRSAGAEDSLIGALRSARQILPKEVLLARYRSQARDLAAKKSYPDAENQYRAALQLAPQDAALYSGLAHVLAEQKKWGDAVGAYREAARLKPGDAETHFDFGVALRESEDVNAATNEWATAVKLQPDDPRPYEELGRVFTEKRDWTRAATAYRAVIRLKPESPFAYEQLGLALRNKGDSREALAAFQAAVRTKPDSPVAHNNLGFALEEKGELQAALEQYRLAMQLSPQDEAIHTNFERVNRRLERPSLVKK
jgi:Flp pilus assembly protein TadD